jgi:hypothetical protein
LDWTFVSPAASIHPGERTGRYRVGRDQLRLFRGPSRSGWGALGIPRKRCGGARTAKPPAELGIERPGSFITLRIDETGPDVTVQPDQRPGTILNAEPEVVLELAAGAIIIDQAVSVGGVQGDRRVLTTMFAGTQT